MPSLRDIRRRIRGVRNTAQITKAMELVAASRMRRAQQRVIGGATVRRDDADVHRGAGGVRPVRGDELHPLLEQRPVDTVGIILLTTDRGLCGALNTNMIRRASELILEQTADGRADDDRPQGPGLHGPARLQDLRVRHRAG